VKAPQLASVWRSVSLGVNVTISDAELLRRYQLDKTEEDFAALVQRYGRLVWMVCRNLTRCEADADDAFQATFIVFLRNAHKLRDAGKLPAWLHGVAYRVCSKARLAAQRRQTRETKRAKPDAAVPVPDSRWDEALAAVQEEVARLPENLRVPFVVCCLEGVGQVEAAKTLGWKLGTLSGRLTRAKDRLMARLEARGVVMSLAGFVAGLALGSAPAASVAKVMLISTVGAVVPTTILQLSTGVLGMGSTKLKLLLAGLFVTGGLGLGVGSGWINAVGAQQSGGPAATKKTQIEDALHQQKLTLQLVEQELAAAIERRTAVKQSIEATEKMAAEKAKQLEVTINGEKLPLGKPVKLEYVVTQEAKDSPKWQYDIVAWKKMKVDEFKTMLATRDAEGWEYVGSNDFTDGTVTFVSWVFRKPTKPTTTLDVTNKTGETLTLLGKLKSDEGKRYTEAFRRVVDPAVAVDVKKDVKVDLSVNAEAQELKAQIEVLTARLRKMEESSTRTVLRYLPKDVPADVYSDALDTVVLLGSKKFPNTFKLTNQKETNSILLEGNQQAVKWAKDMLDKLVGTRPAKPDEGPARR
jgi:RNA polymerase sigma factor (sigma-70 family)